MNILSIGSGGSNPLYQTNALDPFQQMLRDFETLGAALNSGNLPAAQKAFMAVRKNLPAAASLSKPPSGGSQSSKQINPAAGVLDDLETALQSGNLAATHRAYAAWRKILQRRQPGRSSDHHDEGRADASADPEPEQSLLDSASGTGSASDPSSPTGNILDVTA